jgi:hypothetical protein
VIVGVFVIVAVDVWEGVLVDVAVRGTDGLGVIIRAVSRGAVSTGGASDGVWMGSSMFGCRLQDADKQSKRKLISQTQRLTLFFTHNASMKTPLCCTIMESLAAKQAAPIRVKM